MSSASPPLRRKLGLASVTAIAAGNMLGSGIFFTPGELAAVATDRWQVYFFWALCGAITLCGALALAELTTRLPRAGAAFHIIGDAYGPFWAFLTVWMQMWVSGPGSVAGIAIVFGEFLVRFLGGSVPVSPAVIGAMAIAVFALVNLRGVEWGGGTQVALTAAKVVGLLALVLGSLLLADAAPAPAPTASEGSGWLGFIRLVGLGVAAVLFTYDGWVDVANLAGEVDRPRRSLPWGLALGVAGISLLYLLVNYAYLRVVPLDAMRLAPTTVANEVARGAFGPSGGAALNALIMLSIFGALGGLVMTQPRLFYAMAERYRAEASGTAMRPLFRLLSHVSGATAVPSGAIVFCAALSVAAILFFGSFSRLVTFFVVPLQISNILVVAAVFRLPRGAAGPEEYRTPGYPLVPLVFIGVMTMFLVSAVVYQPMDTLIGVALTATGVPVYRRLARGGGAAQGQSNAPTD
ncbi:MAG: amino acid permease [Vicinamibacterales bacterium]